MANNRKKYFYPPAPPSGTESFSPDLVGFQVIDGGGLTQGNFEFTTSIVEKVNRTFNTGVFSNPISLLDIDINSIEESKAIIAKNYRVYPNYDISQVTNYALYGSLQKRLSASITKIINYFPASIEVNEVIKKDYSTANTASNISYDLTENETTMTMDVSRFVNPFDIDYSVNSTRNIEVRPFSTSPLRDLTKFYEKYALYVNDMEVEYPFVDFVPSNSVSAGTITVTVQGNPFSGASSTTDTLILRPSKYHTEVAFKEPFDEVEDFLLNRFTSPPYKATFDLVEETNSGKFVKTKTSVVWPKNGVWNLDIVTDQFNEYLNRVSEIALVMDNNKTDLIVRFLTTGAFKDFDTGDQKIEKVLQIYGRSFDESKKFIDALAYMNSVHYTPQNDIPSELLKNLAQTLGWDTNISPITNDDFLSSVFGTKNSSIYPGFQNDPTPQQLNYQYYRNLILNSAYLFKSKGTRKSIEAILRLVGAPKDLIKFNEIVYVADGPINIERFNGEFLKISGGTKVDEIPTLDPTITYSIQGTVYTGFTTSTSVTQVDSTIGDYPIDDSGYPKRPTVNNDFFFEKGSGWYIQTPDHRAPEQLDVTNSTFTGANPDVQTVLEPYTYGQKYFDRFRYFPNMNLGFGLTKTVDNNKSWDDTETGLRRNTDGSYNAYYEVSNEKLVLNAKNVELSLNMGQGILYDIWRMSRRYDYPFPSTGLTAPYPSPYGKDWTIINPRPKNKTFFEFAQTFYNNMINVRNRQTINDGAHNGYPTLQSIYWKYLQSEQTVNIPSNKYTYQKMIDFTLGIGDYWTKLLEQMVPASTIWIAGQEFDDNTLLRQKFVWRRQRGCELQPVECIPCEYNGQLYSYDCIDQTINCDVNIDSMPTILTNSIDSCVDKSGYTYSDCVLSTLVSDWYVDVRLDNTILVQEKFFTGYGNQQYPTMTQWINALNSKLEYLYQDGLNYFIDENNILTVSNTTCYDDFTDKALTVNVGVDVKINCTNGN
jgi:hypothetical protein